MINKNFNLHLKLNKLDFNSNQQSQPFTPTDQTLKTPMEVPNNNNNYNSQTSFFQPPQLNRNNSSFYQSSNESDDILTDIDEPNLVSNRKNFYSLYFTNTFDSLLLKIYIEILSKPTTTPFSGSIPPSGLVGRVANEVIHQLINQSSNSQILFDQQAIMNRECLRNHDLQPIILQLIRKRLLELCHNKSEAVKLPEQTTIQCVNTNSNLKSNSISSISLNEMNLMNYNAQQQEKQQKEGNTNSSASSIRSRSSSINLRKQSLTRNNSNNWLHVGNISSLRPQLQFNNDFNISADSLQSIQDYVPHNFMNKQQQQFQQAQQQQTNQAQLNSMMNDYHITPPTSHKSSISSTNNSNINNNYVNTSNYQSQTQTPPYTEEQLQQLQQDSNAFNFLQRSRSSSKNSTLNLNINLNLNNQDQIALDSPFCSSTDEYFPGFQSSQTSQTSQQSQNNDNEESQNTNTSSLKNLFTLSEKKRDSLKLKRGII
ncbi:unnamed protein product [Candida verbasci]|uniref:Uncharacterized protein n=1 Tax=Candida verbasci TaxID=1227364 RepID=A0A9W4TRA0_9ASCO|nr:unnamed protein product [Candida verbasci]